GRDRLGIDDLPPELQGLSISDDIPKGCFHESVRGFKRELVRSALAMHNGNKLKAAKELGISRCYLHRLLNQLEVAGDEQAERELQDINGEDPFGEQEATAAPPPVGRTDAPPARVYRTGVRIA